MITIRQFEESDQEVVKALILAGLVEHWGFLDEMKNPDLEDIPSSYAGSVFLVARSDGRIVGAGALVPRGGGIAEIVRMSVAKEMRQQGIGRLILDELLSQARVWGVKQVILETTASWRDAVEFYLRCGFCITHYKDGDVYFSRELI